jgi:enterochelin esterase-like enzyme
MRDWRFLLLLVLVIWLPACAPAAAGAAPGRASTLTPPPDPAATLVTPPDDPSAGRGAITASAAPLPSATDPAPAPKSTATLSRPPTATPCGEAHGQVEPVAVPSPTLRYAIDALVYLPPCYATSGEQYPVLYLIHGLGFTEDQWVRLGAPETADRLIALGEIAPLIIVMPRDRLDSRLDPAFVTDLVPYVDTAYRTLADGRHRAIGGLSRGGGWSMHLGLRYPRTFGRVGGHSPAIFLGDENNILAYSRAIARGGPVPALYVDIGENDGQRQSARWLDQIFAWFEFEHTYLVQPGGHTEEYWSRHLADYLRFYAGDWRPGHEPWNVEPTPQED